MSDKLAKTEDAPIVPAAIYTESVAERAAKGAARKAAYNDIDQTIESWRLACKAMAAEMIADLRDVTVENAKEVGHAVSRAAQAAARGE